MKSLQVQLIILVSLVVLIFGSVVAGFGAMQSYQQAQRLQDHKLASLVSLAKSHNLKLSQYELTDGISNIDNAITNLSSNVANKQADDDFDFDVSDDNGYDNQTIIFWLDDPRLTTAFTPKTLQYLSTLNDGLYDISGKKGEWRVYLTSQVERQKALSDANRQNSPANLSTKNKLIIAENADIRDILAWQTAKQIMLPMLLLIPLLIIVLFFSINRLFLSLQTATEMLEHNTNQSAFINNPSQNHNLTLITQPEFIKELPREIQPFLRIIQQQVNQLLTMISLNQRFVANASHQLRTPMTAVLLQAEQLKHLDIHSEAGSQSYQQLVDDLLTSIHRNNQLMNQLLLLAKSEQPFANTYEPYQAVEIISEILIDCYPMAEQKQINLGVEQLSEAQPPISALNFKIIVQNLIENAIKYTPNGGTIDVAFYPTHSLATDDTGMIEQIIFEVRDSGQGIAEAELAKVTEPFYQSYAYATDTALTNAQEISTHQTTQTQATQKQATQKLGNGFGLGLSIVNNLVENSGATLSLANRYQQQDNGKQSIVGLTAKVVWQL